jgi:hypothetical protein
MVRPARLLVAVLLAACARGHDHTEAACVMVVSKIQVRGRVLDVASGMPVAGATLWIHSKPEHAKIDADRPKGIEPDAVSAADGTFDLRVSRIAFTNGEPFRLPRFRYAEALAIEKAGYPRQVIDCTKGKWTEHETRGLGDISATADLADVRISR